MSAVKKNTKRKHPGHQGRKKLSPFIHVDDEKELFPTVSLVMTKYEEADAHVQQLKHEARGDFWAYRQLVHADWLIPGWWQEGVADELQDFYNDWIAGKRPKLLLQAPPQHGKSTQVTDFIAWVSGKRPDTKTIFASFSEALGERANREIQRQMELPVYKEIFPDLRLAGQSGFYRGQRYERSSSLLEFVAARGSFRNTTVEGQINGQGLDLGVIDDPIKGRAEAKSEVTRDKVWTWLTDDFFSRFSDKAAMLMIMTRWDLDDPAGRFLQHFPNVRQVVYPAIATEDEKYRKKGEPLFPEWKSLEFLMERKKLYTRVSWESLYQQSPIIEGGGIFPREKFQLVEEFDRREVVGSVRYWDKAGTEADGAYTCGVLMHKLRDGTFLIADVVRGQWGAMRREQMIKQCAQLDNTTMRGVLNIVDTWVEQEPGSGGKESAENTIRNLAGFSVKADKVTGDKEIRAEPYASQVQGGNVKLLQREWVFDFLNEHTNFPSGKFKDQVDAAAGAFNKLTGDTDYDTSLGWVGKMDSIMPTLVR